MASATMSVSIECVNICKSWKGDVSGRFDCSVLSCAWKAPRALTGFLASTTHPSQCSFTTYRRYRRRNRLHQCRCYTSDMGERYSNEALQGVPGSRHLLSTSSKWKLCCSLSFSSESCEEISPESLWEDLIPSISYLSYKELELVRKALDLAFEAHDGQKRRSGEPFIVHPVAVAQILGQLELDWESIAAGLLHDTVEDTNVVTFDRIEKEFGPIVRRIVEGETKVSKLGKIKCKDESHVQDVKADDLRQMFLSMTEEVRVIIVKLLSQVVAFTGEGEGEGDNRKKTKKNPKMGSLPPPYLDFSHNSTKQDSSIDPTKLLDLFKAQQNYLNHFFQNLDLTQTLTFTQTLLNAKGTIFFTGVGKSGFVGQKISQTLVSLGIKSGFLSPVDALHGDIGILDPQDILVMFSKSGNTEELLKLVPCAKAKRVFLISVTSVKPNCLMGLCDLNVHLPLERELCPFDLAPVTSTAIQMVFGDTVAIALMGARNLSKEEYAANHPAGRIGKSLIFKVKDVMKKKEELPICKEGVLIMDQLVELTSKGCGCLLVIDEEFHLLGTFTDGDLRRTLKASGERIFKLTVGEMCNRKPRTIDPDAMAVDAMQKMESPPSPVQFLPVIDQDNVLIGIVTLHGLVSAGL